MTSATARLILEQVVELVGGDAGERMMGGRLPLTTAHLFQIHPRLVQHPGLPVINPFHD
jgi:hypothetical protein